MRNKIRKITIQFRGSSFYTMDYFGYSSLKECMDKENIKRKDIIAWWITREAI